MPGTKDLAGPCTDRSREPPARLRHGGIIGTNDGAPRMATPTRCFRP